MDRLDEIYQRCPEVRSACADSALLDSLESLLGPNILLTFNRHNHATALFGTNRSFRLHRDILQWSRGLIAALVYLDEASADRGATRVIPGSHLLPFVGTPNNGGTWMDEHHVFGDVIEQAVPIPASPGDVILMDGLAFHASGRNLADEPRCVVCLGFRSVDELEIAAPELMTTSILLRGERIYRGRIALDS